MRTRLLFLIMSMVMLCNVQAANIGYCSGEASKSGSFSVEGNTEVSGAVYLTPSLLAPYDGCEISVLRGALASKVNLDRLTLWLREALDGENLAESTVTSSTTPSLAKGWIEVALEAPVTIDASKGLYLGMTYHQKGASKAFSLIGNGYENSFFVCVDDGVWEDRHDEGILSIEAVVSGDSTPEYDLALLEARLDYSSDPDVNIVSVRVANNGSKDVSGFTLGYEYENNPADAVTEHYEVAIPSGGKCDVTCSVPKVGDVFINPLTVTLTGIEGGEDSYADNNSTVARVPSQKKVLVEEFTTERCSNCPRVARYIHEVCDEDAYRDQIVVICHHAGFYTDWLTQPCDEEIGWLYGCNSAPAVMYDRTTIPGGGITDCPETRDLRNNFDRQLALTPAVGISLAANMNESTGEIIVDVSLKRESALDMADPRLSIYLTEDNINPVMQSGDGEGTHIHQHVIRAYNSTWGDKIEWDGSDYTKTFRFELDPTWKAEDLRAVAFVNNYDSENKANNKVDNVEVCRISANTNTVVEIEAEIVGCRYYDLSGREVSEDTKGFLLKVTRCADGSTATLKILNR